MKKISSPQDRSDNSRKCFQNIEQFTLRVPAIKIFSTKGYVLKLP